jgi:pheromone shutdown protein TraB
VEVGFEGGQVIGGFVDAASVDQLERALHEDGPRVIVLELEDGRYHVVVPRVSYLRRFNRASRVGFASG